MADQKPEPAGVIPFSDDGENWLATMKRERLEARMKREGWSGTYREYIKHLDEKMLRDAEAADAKRGKVDPSR